MPLSKEKKEIIIERLRKLSDYSLSGGLIVPAERKNPTAVLTEKECRIKFPKLVELEIQDILSKKKNIGVSGWGTRCKEIREKKNHTPAEAAEIIGISRKSLQNEENKNEETDIDPFYLEAFSLLYNESPFTLLGLPEPAAEPFRDLDDTISKYINAIFASLYIEDQPEKIEFLEVIAKIAALSDNNHNKLISFLKKNTRLFPEVFKQNVLNNPTAKDYSWRKKTLELSYYRNNLSPAAIKQRIIFAHAYRMVENLEKRRSPRIEELAQFAVSDGETGKKVKKVLYEIIESAGYPGK